MALERLLVLVDFSDGSQVALDRARQVAKQVGARLQVLHAIGSDGSAPESAVSAMAQSASERVDQIVEGLRDEGVVASGRIHPGSALEAFERVEDELRPDLVVVGARGATRLRRLLLGSTAHAIVQHSFAPVLVARAGLDEEPKPFHRVLVATDFSPDPLVAASTASEIAASGAAVHIAHVFQSPPQAIAALGPHVVDQQRRGAQERLDRFANELQAVPHLLDGNAPHALVRLADGLGCDLIALGTRGADSVSWLGPGSVAGAVLQLAGTSVLAARRAQTRPEICADLEAVQAELSRSEEVAGDQRAAVTELLRNLRRLVDESRELRHGMLAEFCDDLDQIAEELQGKHPKLSSAVRALRRALAGMGV